MVEIRRVRGNELSVSELESLMEIYRDNFGNRLGCEGDELAEIVTSNVNWIKETPERRIDIVAYDKGRPVGFLFSREASIFQRTLFDSIARFYNAEGEEEKEYLWSHLALTLSGYMLKGGSFYAIDREDVEQRKIQWTEGISWLPLTTEGDIGKMATAVSERYRGNGIARKMNLEFEEFAILDGANLAYTFCSEDPAILELNSSLDYCPILRVEPFYGDKSSTDIMVKKLTQNGS